MQTVIPKATNIKCTNADGTQFSAEINGKRWSGICEGSTDWKSVEKAIEDGVEPAPYVKYVPTPSELLAQTDSQLLALSARTLEDILDERITAGKFVNQKVKDKIAERKTLRGQI